MIQTFMSAVNNYLSETMSWCFSAKIFKTSDQPNDLIIVCCSPKYEMSLFEHFQELWWQLKWLCLGLRMPRPQVWIQLGAGRFFLFFLKKNSEGSRILISLVQEYWIKSLVCRNALAVMVVKWEERPWDPGSIPLGEKEERPGLAH